MKPPPLPSGYHVWTRRLSTMLILVIFPLIWVGGLVTTFDAGMAVPDWPNTYGYNLFLYPVYDWFFGPWDLFVEHGHRLLASLAGLLTIALVMVTYRDHRQRTWFRRLALLTLALVLFQGVLGGLRVVLDERKLAMIHGCVGPVCFLSAVSLWVFSSRWWHRNSKPGAHRLQRTANTSLIRFSSIMLVACLIQLIIGANIRHIAIDAHPLFYQNLVVAHLLMAVGILIGSLMLAMVCLHRNMRRFGFGRYGIGLILCVIGQIGLGAATWIVKFGWPAMLGSQEFASGFVVAEKNFLQMNIVTAHVATGSLILAILTFILCRSIRITSYESRSTAATRSMEATA